MKKIIREQIESRQRRMASRLKKGNDPVDLSKPNRVMSQSGLQEDRSSGRYRLLANEVSGWLEFAGRDLCVRL